MMSQLLISHVSHDSIIPGSQKCLNAVIETHFYISFPQNIFSNLQAPAK